MEKVFFFVSTEKTKNCQPRIPINELCHDHAKDTEIFFDKIQHPFIKKKPLSKVGIEKNFLNLMKRIYQKIPAANIILNGEILDAFLLKLGTRQG